MTEPAAGIIADLFVLFAAFMLLRAVRGRYQSRPKTFRLGLAAEAVVELCMAVFTLFMSTPPILGLQWSVREPVAGLAIFIGMVSAFAGLLLLMGDPAMFAAYLRVYMPAGLHHMLFGNHDHHPTSAGE